MPELQFLNLMPCNSCSVPVLHSEMYRSESNKFRKPDYLELNGGNKETKAGGYKPMGGLTDLMSIGLGIRLRQQLSKE